MIRYYLPKPYIQVYGYEVRLLGRETMRVGFRPVAVPDLSQGYMVDHDFGLYFEDRLQITTSPEGLLEYVGYRRVPKQVEAAAAAARMALSFAAPLPGPLKGEDGLPEFSRLVFRNNYSVEELLTTSGKEVRIGNRPFILKAKMLTLSAAMKSNVDADERLQKPEQRQSGRSTNLCLPCPPSDRKGLIHRPLMPLEVSLEEMGATKVGVEMTVESTQPITNVITLTTTNKDNSATLLTLSPPNEPTGTNPPPAKPSKSLATLTRMEAPILLTEIVYCANPWETDTFFVPKSTFAKQSFELQLAGGSLYDARIARDSELMSFMESISGVAGGAIRIPAQLFTFTVVHEDRTAEGGGASGGGGDKAPRRYTGAEDKVPRRYINIYDKE